MRIVTWNVNSVRARKDRLLHWLATRQPDVLCLQELKCVEADFPLEEVRALGYHAALHGQKTWNGVAILSREPSSDVRHGMADGVEDPQCRVLGATVQGVRVYSLYCPNGQGVGSEAYAYKLQWFSRLLRVLQQAESAARPLALCGDFNIAPTDLDVHDPAAWAGQTLCTGPERACFQQLLGWGLEDTFRRHHPGQGGLFSWWDYRMLGFPKNRGLRIDHVLATPPLAARCTGAGIDREERKGKQPSDHAPAWAEFSAAP
ncbi:MAG: exodeoxyribonuclease III [Deltaproteobacteria bacterium]|nr:exodeoxyribonuclease III [Deltaproteobacteria bacterium]